MPKKGKAIILTETRLIDSVLADIQKSLAKNLEWLDKAFGRSQRITREINGKHYISPACFSGGIEYIDVSPDQEHGNYSFFVIQDPQEVSGERWLSLTVKFDLIFWFSPILYKLQKLSVLRINKLNHGRRG